MDISQLIWTLWISALLLTPVVFAIVVYAYTGDANEAWNDLVFVGIFCVAGLALSYTIYRSTVNRYARALAQLPTTESKIDRFEKILKSHPSNCENVTVRIELVEKIDGLKFTKDSAKSRIETTRTGFFDFAVKDIKGN